MQDSIKHNDCTTPLPKKRREWRDSFANTLSSKKRRLSHSSPERPQHTLTVSNATQVGQGITYRVHPSTSPWHYTLNPFISARVIDIFRPADRFLFPFMQVQGQHGLRTSSAWLTTTSFLTTTAHSGLPRARCFNHYGVTLCDSSNSPKPSPLYLR